MPPAAAPVYGEAGGATLPQTPDEHACCLLSVTRVRARDGAAARQIAAGFEAATGQLAQARGLVAASLRREDVRTFWTMTLWRDIGAMAGFRNDDPHRTWMGNVEALCDESAYMRCPWPSSRLPGWPQAQTLFLADARFTRMEGVSADQAAGRVTVGRLGRVRTVAVTPPKPV